MQVSRLGNPLVNEVLVPDVEEGLLELAADPSTTSSSPAVRRTPSSRQLLPALYPGVFPNLDGLNKGTPKRDDLVAIFHTGIPAGIVPGFQNSMGTTQADMLRLNLAIPPTAEGANNLGLIGNDPAGFPNGRRVFDDVVTIELRAVAGATLPLVDKTLHARRGGEPDHRRADRRRERPDGDGHRELPVGFPYLGTPHSGFSAGT